MMHNGYGMMGYGMGFWWLFQILIILFVFMIIWWIIKSSGSFGFRIGNESALDILKKRLAKGEIDDKEFHRLKKEIED